MRVNQREAVRLSGPSGRTFGPPADITTLRIPPHRILMKIADHEHSPPRFSHDRLEGHIVVAGVHPIACRWPTIG